MRLVSYLVEGEPRFGAAVAGGVVDLTQRLGPKCPDLRSLIAKDGLHPSGAMYAAWAALALPAACTALTGSQQ